MVHLKKYIFLLYFSWQVHQFCAFWLRIWVKITNMFTISLSFYQATFLNDSSVLKWATFWATNFLCPPVCLKEQFCRLYYSIYLSMTYHLAKIVFYSNTLMILRFFFPNKVNLHMPTNLTLLRQRFVIYRIGANKMVFF